MKTQGMILALAALLMGSSACTVKCHFEKDFVVKGAVEEEDCTGRVKICPTYVGRNGPQDCRSKMRIECGGVEIYDGPFNIKIHENKITYIAKDFDGEREDAPRIVTEIPNNPGDRVDAFERDDDSPRAEGECRYESLITTGSW